MLKKILAVLLVFSCGYVHAALQVQSWTLTNGARVLFVESHANPILDVSVEFDAGARRDPVDKSGTAALTNLMLARGLQQAPLPGVLSRIEPALSEARISDTLADAGAQLAEEAGSDRAGMKLRTLASLPERDASLTLMARLLAQPSFPDDFLTREKARTIASIKEELTKPEAIANKAFARVLYGTHPYGRETTVDSVAAITREDLVAFHQMHYVANHAVITIIGDITRAQAETMAEQLTVRLPQGAPLPPLPETPPTRLQHERIPHPASQSHILIGAPALARGDSDYFALLVGNYVLGGGGFVSRLTNEVREKRGLVYSIHSYFTPLAQKGPFEIGLQTKKEQTDAALKVVQDTLATYWRDGPSAQELKAAKDNLIGGFALRIDNNRKILDQIAVIGFYRLPLDYLDTWTANIAKVTITDIKAAFHRKIAIDKLATIIVGTSQPE